MPFSLFKGLTVDTDAVGAVGHWVRDRIQGHLVIALKSDMHLTLSASILVVNFTGTHGYLSVLIADVVPVIRQQRPPTRSVDI